MNSPMISSKTIFSYYNALILNINFREFSEATRSSFLHFSWKFTMSVFLQHYLPLLQYYTVYLKNKVFLRDAIFRVNLQSVKYDVDTNK